MRVLYQGPATITRSSGSRVPAEVAIWEDDTGIVHEWGGRAVIEAGHSLISEIGGTCAIRWPVPGGIMVGAFVLGGGQVGNAGETYRLQGTGGLTLVAADS